MKKIKYNKKKQNQKLLSRERTEMHREADTKSWDRGGWIPVPFQVLAAGTWQAQFLLNSERELRNIPISAFFPLQ